MIEFVTQSNIQGFVGNPIIEQHRLRYSSIIQRQDWEFDQYDIKKEIALTGAYTLCRAQHPFYILGTCGHLIFTTPYLGRCVFEGIPIKLSSDMACALWGDYAPSYGVKLRLYGFGLIFTVNLRFLSILLMVMCATFVLGVSAYAKTENSRFESVRIGGFHAQEKARSFYQSLSADSLSDIDVNQLWLESYSAPSGQPLYYIEIIGLIPKKIKRLCAEVHERGTRCIKRTKMTLFDTNRDSIRHVRDEMSALGFNLAGLHKNAYVRLSDSEKLTIASYVPPFVNNMYDDESGLALKLDDGADDARATPSYNQAKRRFIQALQAIDAGAAPDDTLINLARSVVEQAGDGYLTDLAKRFDVSFDQPAAGQDEASLRFIHEVKKSIAINVNNSARGLVKDTVSQIASGLPVDQTSLQKHVDGFVVSSAQTVIEASVKSIRRSHLYALRNLELEYNLNNFEDSYFSVLATQPVYQSQDARHNVFLQGSGVINEQSVDIDDDESRHTLNLGLAYRNLSADERSLVGANVFFDHQWPYGHSRMSVGFDMQAKGLNLATNYYIPLTDYKDGRTDDLGNQYEERVLQGYDLELGYTPLNVPDLTVFAKGYQYFRETHEDHIIGLEVSGEYEINDHFLLKGSLIEENGGRDGVEVALQYRVPLYDVEPFEMAEAALDSAVVDGEKQARDVSLRNKVFDKVRRDNRMRLEERVKYVEETTIITAQFNSLSSNLPYNVGGVLTAANVTLPYDTAITVPNTEFGIIEFSNGSVANISASGGGDVVLEFNTNTLTITATNGGFVQFISAGGGISTIIVPGGTVNLLGTDVDVTDDGTTTTIQVRSGEIDVVADIGSDQQSGDLGEIVSLTQASGALALLTDPDLTTRQEAAFTNLDLANPLPSTSASATPTIDALPSLISAPQSISDNADIQLSFTKPVSVSGAPFLNALVGVNARTFAYEASASSSTKLVFRYVYVAADVGTTSMTVQDLDLNGGTIIGTSDGLEAVTAFTETILKTDITAPVLSSSIPADEAVSVSSMADIVLTFDENMQAGSGNIVLTDLTDGSDTRQIPVTDAQVTISGTTVTINPSSDLDLVTDYELTIASGVLEDTAGNAFSGLTSGALTFTISNDPTPPTLSSSSPSDDATSVARDTDIVLSFSENVFVGTGNITLHQASDDTVLETIAVGSGNVTGGGTSTITINPSSDLLFATEFYVLVPPTAFDDVAGNDFAGISGTTDLSFSTFSPTQIAGIAGWWDADDASTITLNGSTSVAQFDDKSSNSNHALQGTTSTQPIYGSDSEGAFIQFGQSPIQYLEFTSPINAKSVFAVVDWSGTSVAMFIGGDTGNTSYLFIGDPANSYAVSIDGAAGDQGSWYLNGALKDNGGNIGNYADLVSGSPQLHTVVYNVGDPNFDMDFMGAHQATSFRNSKIREMIVYDAYLSNADREAVEAYLMEKRGL